MSVTSVRTAAGRYLDIRAPLTLRQVGAVHQFRHLELQRHLGQKLGNGNRSPEIRQFKV